MENRSLNSTILTSIFEGNNSVIFDIGGRSYLYERLGNSIHGGTREQIEHLANLAESVEYSPKFESESMTDDLTGKISSLLLSVTEACNIGCAYCINSKIYATERMKSKKSMSWDVAKSAIDMFLERAYDMPNIQFYGGEATLKLDLMKKAMEYARGINPSTRFAVTTNGTNLEELAELLLEYDMKATVSMDGPKEVHDKYRRDLNDNPTHDIVSGNLERFRQANPDFAKTNISISATIWDPDDFRKVVDYFIGLDGLYFGLYIGSVEKKGLSEKEKKRHQSSHSMIDDYMAYGLRYITDIAAGKQPPLVLRSMFDRQMNKIYALSSDKIPDQLPLNEICLPGEFFAFSDVDGNLHVCEKMTESESIGSVKEGVNPEVQEDYIQKLKAAMDENCSPCWLDRLCHPCFAMAKDSSNSISAEGLSERCREYKDSKIGYISLFARLLEMDTDKNHINYFKGISPFIE